MSAQNPYNSGNVPYGSFRVSIKTPAGADLDASSYVLENIPLTRPGKVLERPDELGAPNGWTLTAGFPTGSAVIQTATSTTPWPYLGCYFEEDFGFGVERWVITDISQPFDMQGYYKGNVTIRLDPGKSNSAP